MKYSNIAQKFFIYQLFLIILVAKSDNYKNKFFPSTPVLNEIPPAVPEPSDALTLIKVNLSTGSLRKLNFISNTLELSEIIKNCLPKKNTNKKTIHPATKTFQAIRIFVNDELNELKKSLEKTIKILNSNGLILVVSFQSLEDRIVKDFFNHNSGKRWRSSRHYPELPDKLATQLKIITKKPILPSASEILENPRSRSAKLRVAQKI